jgi:hypothetical protein
VPAPTFTEEQLDAYAMVFARVALDRLMREMDQNQYPADDHGGGAQKNRGQEGARV